MPFGAVFTSSSGGSVGGPLPFTRIRGQLLVGQSPEPPASGSQTGTQPGGATGYNGSAAAPLYSYYNHPDSGFYASNQTSSASDIRYSQIGTDLVSYTTAGVAPWANSTGGFGSTAATNPLVYITQTTATSVPGVAPAVVPGNTGVAALSWDSAAKTLEVYSTVTGAWMRLHSSTGAALVFSSS